MPDDVVHEVADGDVLPEGAGIAEILRWAMARNVPLQHPPWEDAFCGTDLPCVYAGMVEGRGVHEENRRAMSRRHAEWLVEQMSMVTPAQAGRPAVIEYPSRTFYIAVCDAKDHSSPRIEMFVYDRGETLRKHRPCVEWFDADEVERGRRRGRQSPLRGMRTLALAGFVIEMENVIRNHLLRQDAEREQAIAELATTHPEVIKDADVPGSTDVERPDEADAGD